MKYENMQHIWLKPGPLVRAVKGLFKQPTCLGSKYERFQHFKVEIINLNQCSGQTGEKCCSGTWKKYWEIHVQEHQKKWKICIQKQQEVMTGSLLI